MTKEKIELEMTVDDDNKMWVSYESIDKVFDYYREKQKKLTDLLRDSQYELRYSGITLGKKFSVPKLINKTEQLFKELEEETHG